MGIETKDIESFITAIQEFEEPQWGLKQNIAFSVLEVAKNSKNPNGD